MKGETLKKLLFKAASSQLDHRSPVEARELMQTLETLLLSSHQTKNDQADTDQNGEIDGAIQVVLQAQEEAATWTLSIGTYVHF
jgi:hypothetical protein